MRIYIEISGKKMSKTTDSPSVKTIGDVVLQEIWRIKDTLSASYGHR